jgi:hypothetical protein
MIISRGDTSVIFLGEVIPKEPEQQHCIEQYRTVQDDAVQYEATQDHCISGYQVVESGLEKVVW